MGETAGVDDAYVDRVLLVVERIPAGRVMSYGDIAEYVGTGGPRQVGQVMARYGGAVPWWRVVRADGTPPPCHDREAMAHLKAEGVAVRPGGDRIDMRHARWSGHSPT